jgi:hypothetical protein
MFCYAVIALANNGLSQIHEVFAEESANDCASYIVILPTAEFGRDALIRTANMYLQRYDNIRLLDVKFVSDAAAAQELKGKGTFHFTYQTWGDRFETLRRQASSKVAAELLAFGGSAALRIRHADGYIEEIRLKGESVFHPVVGGYDLDLLYVAFAPQGIGRFRSLVATLYLKRSQSITAQEAGTISRALRQRTGIPANIVIRQDEWFIFDPYYPWLNPFTSAHARPSESQLAASREFFCARDGGEPCYEVSAGDSGSQGHRREPPQ